MSIEEILQEIYDAALVVEAKVKEAEVALEKVDAAAKTAEAE